MFLNPEATSPVVRLPASKYEGHNGFTSLEYPGPHLTEAEQEASALTEPTRAALDAHRTAQYILTQKDRPIPTLEEMEKELEPDTAARIKERITDLEKQHLSDLQRLYLWHAEEYLDEALDRYLSKDDLQYLAEGENNLMLEESYAQLATAYEESRRNIQRQMQWEDDVERMRYSHLVQLTDLRAKLRQQEIQDEQERKRREADFPTDLEDFNRKPKDVQLRVARFLTLTEPARQERMLSEFGWASRQVKPLQEIYNKNDAFKAQILASLIEVKDPRKRF
ncbi:hypothetical protein LshimejAT787_1302160 [Lyophyllum shimeji]|uniref:Uncharacterized protein n=1 Tax=Lyophyllum shimeji TaxID=47721 RepID=A0A9P3UT82_LYOSH|nr:hypothetical protein LshimejAT787_1302160 [Lyophyllum shimeji]